MQGDKNRIESFRFKQFGISDARCAMKTGTDAVLLGAWADCTDAHSIADIGAGSGVIALMLAQRALHASVIAVECDSDAAGEARGNVMASPFADRITVVECDFAGYRPPSPPDLIVSNPPFFTSGELSPDGRRAAARHAATLSPLSLIDYAADVLFDSGSLALIMPYERQMIDEVIYRAEMLRLKERRCLIVSAVEGRPPVRILLQLSRHDGHRQCDYMAIRNADGNYTTAMQQLTHEFYLHL